MNKLWKIGTDIASYIDDIIEKSKQHGNMLKVSHEGDHIVFSYPDGFRETKTKSTASQYLRVVMSVGLLEVSWVNFDQDKSVLKDNEYEVIQQNQGEGIGDFIAMRLIDRVEAIFESNAPMYPSEESFVFSLLATFFARIDDHSRKLIDLRLQNQKVADVEKYYWKVAGWLKECEEGPKEKLISEARKYIVGITKDTEKIIKTISPEPSKKVSNYISEKNLEEQLQAKALTFGMFFDQYFVKSKNIIIPVYQRKYIWPKDTVKTLLNDIKNAASYSTHYIGNIVAKTNTSYMTQEVKIIDGQQRITTLCIIARALNDYSKYLGLPVEKIANDRFGVFEHDNTITKTFNRVKGNEDYEAFKIVMKGQTQDSKTKKIASNIIENYNETLNWLSVNVVAEEEVEKFWKSLFNAITFIVIDAKASDEYKLFEKLNTGAVPLTILELFKNYIIDAFSGSNRNLSDQEVQELFDEFIDSKFNKKTQKIEIEKFITSYIRTENSQISGDTIFNQFKNLIEQKYIINSPHVNLQYVLEQLGEEIDLYNEISTYKKYNSSTSFTKYYKDFLYMFDGRNVYFPLIIRLIKMCFKDYKNPTIDEANNFREYMRVLEIFEVRLQVAIYRGQSLSTKIEQILLQLTEETTPSELWQMVVSKGGKSSIATVDQLKEALESKPIANKPARLILTRLENYFSLPKKWAVDKDVNFVGMYDNPSQREHLLPVEWNENWKDKLESWTGKKDDALSEYVNKYINYIGNAFPIPEWSNKSVNNLSLLAKINKFNKTQYHNSIKTFNGIEGRLDPVDFNSFTPKTILDRSKQIAIIAKEIWADYV